MSLGPWRRADSADLPLPWLRSAWARAVAQRGHALLLHGPAGVGQFELAALLSQTWLCESPGPDGLPCGRCEACHLLQVGSHPDWRLLAPAALREGLGLAQGSADAEEGEGAAARDPAGGEGGSGGGKGKAAGREIRVADVRAAIDWAHQTSSRSRAKVLVLHPAERLNVVAANALLKTLEEPPGMLRMVLSASDPQRLMPTLRSRCQKVGLTLPPVDQATSWLQGQGVSDAAVLLKAAGGRPQEARAMAQEGLAAELWLRLPGLVRQGRPEALAALPVPRVLDALQKLCLDLMARGLGVPASHFPNEALPSGADVASLSGWWQQLQRTAHHADHPWNAGLLIESLVLQGRRCWKTPAHVR